PGGQESLDAAPPGVAAPATARRAARPVRLRAHALPLGRDRRPDRRRRPPARRDRPHPALVRPGALAHLLPRHLDPDRARPARRDRRLPPLRLAARTDELPRAYRPRVLLRRAASAPLDDQEPPPACTLPTLRPGL